MTETRPVPQVRRACVLAWGGAAVSWELSSPGPLVPSLTSCAAFLLLATGCALHMRQRLMGELRRTQEIAGAAQSVLLRPLPARMEGLGLAAVHGTAVDGASMGGDLYDALATPFGVRVVMGDVRGHGPGSLGAAAAVLGAFREAAYDEPALGDVLRRLERALHRASADPEEFVTVLLLEITADGAVTAVNCGHPWPYLLSPTAAEVMVGDETLPPLGVLPLPDKVESQAYVRLAPGEALFLHTDGVEDARDRGGRHFPLGGVLAEAGCGAVTPARLVAGVHAALLRHAGGRPADDVALLVLRNDRLRPAGP
ncbi:PP2C family protein-serine/threonine phosphatase [Streptomyces sp. NPDC090022]|uniref:PP2C family protein-serine/threonine phosphatase n=1 Tax=Streptomyces sp. NPDC090022 TaxID=3365920 RepID=UPI003804488F